MSDVHKPGCDLGIKDLVLVSPVLLSSIISAVRREHSAPNSQDFRTSRPRPVRQDLRQNFGRLSCVQQAPDYANATPLAKALIAANADRIVWGTDWPHPNSSSGKPLPRLRPCSQIDDGRLMNQLVVWAPTRPRGKDSRRQCRAALSILNNATPICMWATGSNQLRSAAATTANRSNSRYNAAGVFP